MAGFVIVIVKVLVNPAGSITANSGAPLLRKDGNPSMREILAL